MTATNRKLHISDKLSLPIDTIITRLERNLVVDTNGCWLWTGYKKNGYGFVCFGDPPKGVYVHRLSFLVYKGSLEGKQACHSCDIRACFNPDHLFRGTQLDNVRDMRAKLRHKNPPRIFGLKNYNARLTKIELVEIRKMFDAKSDQREIARKFGCSQSTVWRIGHRLTRVWA